MHTLASSPAFGTDKLLHLLELTRQLAAPLDLCELLGQVVQVGRDILDADRGSVFLYDEARRELFSEVATGEQEIRFSIEQGIAGECARTQRVINVPDCYSDPRFNDAIDRQTGYRTRCLIAVPLLGLEHRVVGVLQLLNPVKGWFDAGDEKLAEILASQAGVAVQRARLQAERVIKLRLEQDLAAARRIQTQFLPSQVPAVRGYDVAAATWPADETGGDTYDLVATDAGGLRLLLADATGHGIGPALAVSQARAMVRMGLRMSDDLDEIHHRINEQLCHDLDGSLFITALVGKLDPATHRFDYIAAGQGPLLIYRAKTDTLEWRRANTIPWGVLEDPPPYEAENIQMQPGDTVLLATDGFYECEDPAGEMLGLDAVGELVRGTVRSGVGADAVVQALRQQVDTHGAGLEPKDDLTAIVLQRGE